MPVRSFRCVVLVVVAFFGAHAFASGAQDASRLGSLGGVVIDGVLNEPVAEARVTICGRYSYPLGSPESRAAGYETTTDAQGRFVFDQLPPGNYHLCVDPIAISLTDGMRSYEVRPGEVVRDIVKRVWPKGGIDGRVVDERGDAATGVRLSVVGPWLASGIDDIRRWQATVTDVDGRFHLGSEFGIGGFERHGRVAIMTSAVQLFAPAVPLPASGPGPAPIDRLFAAAGLTVPSSPPPMGSNWNGFVELLDEPIQRNQGLAHRSLVDPIQFVPAVATGHAIEFFSMVAGERRRNVGIQLRPVPAFRVSGRIVGANVPVKNMVLSLERAYVPPIERPIPTAVCLTDAAGRFAFLRVPPGDYRIRADTAPYGGGVGGPPEAYSPTVSVDAPVVVNANVDDLSIDAHRGVSIHGSIRFEGTGALPAAKTYVELRLTKMDGSVNGIPMIAAFDGSFASGELPPGEYLLRRGGFPGSVPPGWVLKSAIVAGTLDMVDVPLVLGNQDPGKVVVTFSEPHPSEIGGQVRTAQDAPDPEATVLVFSTDRRYWSHNSPGADDVSRTRIALTSRLGAYTIARVRPGEYFVVAVPDSDESWMTLGGSLNPDLFQRLSTQATRITVTEGAKIVQDLRTQK